MATVPNGAYLERLSHRVRADLEDAITLAEFLDSVKTLDTEQRLTIVAQAKLVLEENYAHLPIKRAMYAVNPVQRLRLLRQELVSHSVAHGAPKAATPRDMTDVEFHREMIDIFNSVRDLHTRYVLPDSFRNRVAFLPFMVEDYREDGRPRYIVSHVAEGLEDDSFHEGVEVKSWNGIPIDTAVLNNARRFSGSNREAQHARGVETLTVRALDVAPPPDEEWVILGYLDKKGQPAEIRFDWLVKVTPAGDRSSRPDRALLAFGPVGIDSERDMTQRIRKTLLARRDAQPEYATRMPQVFEATDVVSGGRKFGYLRVRTFHVRPWEFFREFQRLIEELPQDGLIIDVRGNPGGYIGSGEYILQLLTPRTIEPEPAQFANTRLNLAICSRNQNRRGIDYSRWVRSMTQALQTDATHSAAFPISDPVDANYSGQRYFGPVVLIVDALCYSTTDMFAAGFQDHQIGPILGTERNTGAGGAEVTTHEFIRGDLLTGDALDYTELPEGSGINVAFRRTLRVGDLAGTPLEDFGLTADVDHELTKDDLLKGNPDLKEKAASILREALEDMGGEGRKLEVEVKATDSGGRTITMKTRHIDRVDPYMDGRPYESMDVMNDTAEISIEKFSSRRPMLEIRGFYKGELVARYRERIEPTGALG